MSAIASLWQALELGQKAEPGWHVRGVPVVSDAAVLAGIHQPTGARGLLVEVAARSIPHGVDYPVSEGFRVVPEPLVHGPSGVVRLSLVLEDKRYSDVFTALVEDVFQTIEGVREQPDLVKAFVGRLNTWQVFASTHGPGGLTPEEQTGLFAELSFIDGVLLPRCSAQTAVAAWEGPAGGVHDFVCRNADVEVKATTAVDSTLVWIANLDQLDRLAGRPLLLCHVALVLDEHGLSLPALVAQVRDAIRAQDQATYGLFDRRLVDAGYVDTQAHLYASRSLRVGRIRCFDVGDEFPRLTRGQLHAGILACKYSLDLSACVAFEIDRARLQTLMAGSAND